MQAFTALAVFMVALSNTTFVLPFAHAYSIHHLKKHSNLVMSNNAVETMARVDAFLADMTSTMTAEMKVTKLFLS